MTSLLGLCAALDADASVLELDLPRRRSSGVFVGPSVDAEVLAGKSRSS